MYDYDTIFTPDRAPIISPTLSTMIWWTQTGGVMLYVEQYQITLVCFFACQNGFET